MSADTMLCAPPRAANPAALLAALGYQAALGY